MTACHHFDLGECRSCTLLELSGPEQIDRKTAHARALLPDLDGRWLPPVPAAAGSAERMGVRNKAKMVVTGTSAAPRLGILGRDGAGVDLRDCPLHEPAIVAAMPTLADFVGRASLTPYDLGTRRGELKHLLVTASPEGRLMVRLVCRSQEPVTRIRKHLPSLLAALPGLEVLSVNLQPEHKAVLEGEREIVLQGTALPMRVGDLVLHLRPQSFFQTNTELAGRLYAQAGAWIRESSPTSVWDLYCGVGGFALTAAAYAGSVTGIEISAEAIASARTSAIDLGRRADFVVGDATRFACQASSRSDPVPDLVIVNPPRRGLGSELAGWIEASGVRRVIYSSCNAVTLAADLRAMPSLSPVEARLLDMFPHSEQYEAIVRLERQRP